MLASGPAGCGDDEGADASGGSDSGTLTGPPLEGSGGDSGKTSGADSGGSTAGASTSVATGDLDCASQLPDCDDPIEICQGGDCECYCGDPGSCPADVAGPLGTALCDAQGETCATAAGCCLCGQFPGCGPMPVWACVAASTNPTCPAELPADDLRCETEGQTCNYCSVDSFPAFRVCSNGVWGDVGGPLCDPG